jgi:hypothetical protein
VIFVVLRVWGSTLPYFYWGYDMLCYEVIVNGVTICTAGVGEKGALDLGLNWGPWRVKQGGPTAQEVRLFVGGINSHGHVAWIGPEEFKQVKLDVGDEVTVRIVDLQQWDQPVVWRTGSSRTPSKWSRLLSRFRR